MRRGVAGLVVLTSFVAFVAGCGSGGASAPPPSADGTVSGTVVKGAAAGATVAAFAVANGTMGAQVGGGTTDANGNFAFSIGSYAGPLMLQATGGAYVDEATGATMTVQSGDVLACAIPSVAAGSATTGVQVTPLTTMAHSRVHHLAGGISASSIASTNAAVGAYFSVPDIVLTVPMNPAIAGSGAAAGPAARNYGMAIAAMSRYAMDVGMPHSSGIVTAMAEDASDGVMDGRMSGAPIAMGGGMMAGSMMQPTAGTTGLAASLTAFVGSAMNRSGLSLADVQPLASQLAASSGAIGGGGGTVMGSVSGTVTAGVVAGATVTAYAVSNGAMGAWLGSATTDASGNFTVPMGGYGGPVMLQATGGTFADPATGTTMPMMTGDAMATCLTTLASGSTTTAVQVTPLTTMAWSRARTMPGGMTDANVTAATAAVGGYFSVGDIVHAAPMDPTVAGSGAGATVDQRNHGMAIAAMSRYAHDVGMTTSSSGMISAMTKDASDGVMDGTMGGVAISMAGMGGMMGGMMQANAGTAGLSTAMGAFVSSAMNRSGVTAADMQALMSQLAASSGQLPGAGGTPSPHGVVSGTAFMGPMSSGTVTAFAVNGGAMGAAIGSSPVDASGAFAVPMGAYAGTVMLQLAGGAFVDPATGITMTMQPGDVLTSCVPSLAAGATMAGVQVTPLTSMAQSRAAGMPGGMIAANVSTANAAVGSYFLVGDILTTVPMNPGATGSASGASADARNHGMAVAAMSQYAHAVGMTTSSSGMVTAMMQDASDGTMDGMMGGTPISMAGMGGMMGGMMQANAGTTGLSTAMGTFVASPMNRSGVTAADMQALMTQLATSTGAIR